VTALLGVAVAVSLKICIWSSETLIVTLAFAAIPVLYGALRRGDMPALNRNFGDRLWDGAAVIFVLVSLVFRAWVWKRADGLPFITPGRESFLNYLFARNAHNFFSVVLQDMSTGPYPMAHPYFYLNHPNLFARLQSIGCDILGFGLQQQVFLMMCLSALGLLVLYAALCRAFGPASAFGGLLFAGTNYETFVANAPSLLWGLYHVLLWLLFYVLAEEDSRAWSQRKRVACAALFVIFALSDWGFFIFVAALAAFWISARSDRLPWARILGYIVLPATAAVAFYELAILAAVGPHLFMENLTVNVLHRLGQVENTSAMTAIGHLHANNIVIWPRGGGRLLTVRDLVRHWWAIITLNVGPLRFVVAAVMAGAGICLIVQMRRTIAIQRLLRLAGILALPVFGGLVGAVFLLPSLLTVGFCLVGIVTRRKADLDEDLSAGDPRFYGLMAFIGCAGLATLTTFATFPDYLIDSLFNAHAPNPPAGVLELLAFSAVFALLVSAARRAVRTYAHAKAVSVAIGTATLVTISDWRWINGPRLGLIGLFVCLAFGVATVGPVLVGPSADAIDVVPAVVIAVSGGMFLALAYYPGLVAIDGRASRDRLFVGNGATILPALARPGDVRAAVIVSALGLGLVTALQLTWAVHGYEARPPQNYDYAQLLASPQFRGHSFVTNNDEAAVWAFTGSWAYATGSDLPVPPIRSSKALFVDGARTDRYEYPDYFLCDYNLRFIALVNRVVVPDAAPGTFFPSCQAVADYLTGSGAGDLIEAGPTFAIVSLRRRTSN
jgi:hypothetical protein